MVIWYSPWEYLVGLTLWLLGLAVLLRVLLLRRQKARRLNKNRWLRCWNVALSGWMFLAFLTVCELVFALFVHHTDATNATNISKRWITRHIDGEQNDIGFRDTRDFPKSLPEGGKRVCFFGDSFTAGHGVEDSSDRFSDLIAERLEARQPGKYVINNLGQLGYDASLIEGLVRAALIEGNQMDVVVYVYMMNDIEGFDPRTQEVIQEMQKQPPQPFLIRHTYFLNWLCFRTMQATGPRAGRYFSHLVDSYETQPWDDLAAKLRQLHENCAAHHVDFRMVIFPFLHDLGPDYPFRSAHAKLVQFCQSEGIPVLDLEPILTPHVDEGLKVNPFDSHPNERAHKLAADAIEHQLLQDLFAGNGDPATVK